MDTKDYEVACLDTVCYMRVKDGTTPKQALDKLIETAASVGIEIVNYGRVEIRKDDGEVVEQSN